MLRIETDDVYTSDSSSPEGGAVGLQQPISRGDPAVAMASEALSTLVATAKMLYDASQTAKENCEECAAICRTVVSLDGVIRKSANDYISESMMSRFNKITRYVLFSGTNRCLT